MLSGNCRKVLRLCNVWLASFQRMDPDTPSQLPTRTEGRSRRGPAGFLSPVRYERIIPNPKLKLLEQVTEVMRLKHYSIRTERCYSDWIRRYARFHGMKSRGDLDGGERKIERFLSDLAVKGEV